MNRCPITRARCAATLSVRELETRAASKSACLRIEREPGAHLCDHHEPRFDRHGEQRTRCHTSDGEHVEWVRRSWGVEERRVRS